MLNLPELDVSAAHGMRMNGWDFSQTTITQALNDSHILNPAVELCTNYCPWNCDFCFTENGFASKKRKLASEMSLPEKLMLIDDLAKHGAKSINIVGAGEPTIDPDFFEIVGRIHALGIIPIIYTEASLKLTDRKFCERLYELNATVVVKVNSLWNEAYQNAILVSGNVNKFTPKFNYFTHRATALEVLMDVGFNSVTPTRLAFDTIACRENEKELITLHRYCRDNNIFQLLVNYLPSGRSEHGHTNALSRAEQFELFRQLAEIDRAEYGIEQRGIFPYNGSQPCTIRGTGMFIKINGDVLACPGETHPIGNCRTEPLDTIWQRLGTVRDEFDGGCPPRERFWKMLALSDNA
jgi:MoaA/NifB/PqqE/SkfB family radical SAM enzyme